MKQTLAIMIGLCVLSAGVAMALSQQGRLVEILLWPGLAAMALFFVIWLSAQSGRAPAFHGATLIVSALLSVALAGPLLLFAAWLGTLMGLGGLMAGLGAMASGGDMPVNELLGAPLLLVMGLTCLGYFYLNARMILLGMR